MKKLGLLLTILALGFLIALAWPKHPVPVATQAPYSGPDLAPLATQLKQEGSAWPIESAVATGGTITVTELAPPAEWDKLHAMPLPELDTTLRRLLCPKRTDIWQALGAGTLLYDVKDAQAGTVMEVDCRR